MALRLKHKLHRRCYWTRSASNIFRRVISEIILNCAMLV